MSGFHHEAVFYTSDDEYLDGLFADICEAVDGDGAVLVAVSEAKARLLRDALGDRVDRVQFTDMERLGRNPACIIPVWREFIRDAGPGPLVGVGEPVWAGRSDAELVECRASRVAAQPRVRRAAAVALAVPVRRRGARPGRPEGARHTHPQWSRTAIPAAQRSLRPARGGHGVGRRAAAAVAPALPSSPFTDRDLALVRTFVTERARAAGFDDDRLSDLVLAVNELATNSMRHGGGHGVLRTWEEDGTFLFEVRDGGRIDDPLAGRERRPDARGGGRGLWLVNQLCDLVQVRSSQAGNVVRLHMSLGSV